MKLSLSQLNHYLEALLGSTVSVKRVGDLVSPKEDELKGFGYGNPILIEFEQSGAVKKVVLSTMKGDSFGHDFPSDRAQTLLLAHETFNQLPKHVLSLDVGALTPDGQVISVGRGEEFFILTEFVEGEGYFKDLEELKQRSQPAQLDKDRTLALSQYLVQIHQEKKDAPELYRRRIRDLVGHGEGIMGLVDNYPADWQFLSPTFFENLEKKCVEWRHRLRDQSHRLAQVHGDFHPWNILFFNQQGFWVLDRSRGAWGEPADDLTALSINYLFFSLQAKEQIADPFLSLFNLFWENYLEKTGDEGCLEAAPPFFAWRGLVVASPIWYPNLEPAIRKRLFRFIEQVLATRQFNFREVKSYFA